MCTKGNSVSFNSLEQRVMWEYVEIAVKGYLGELFRAIELRGSWFKIYQGIYTLEVLFLLVFLNRAQLTYYHLHKG